MCSLVFVLVIVSQVELYNFFLEFSYYSRLVCNVISDIIVAHSIVLYRCTETNNRSHHFYLRANIIFCLVGLIIFIIHKAVAFKNWRCVVAFPYYI